MNSLGRFDILVVGAGPAGMAAACCGAESGRTVAVIDDNPDAGGQIWRNDRPRPRSRQSTVWFERLLHAPMRFFPGRRVVAALPSDAADGKAHRLLIDSDDGPADIQFEKLIIATGARELFVPFPGWTLPGVGGAGGLQAMVKGGMPIADKRIVIAGSGPLLLAVAAYLAEHGARIELIAEQAPLKRLIPFGLQLLRHPSKLFQGIGLRRTARCPFLTDCWPTAVVRNGDGLRVTLRRHGQTWDVDCDHLACGFGLVPNLELPSLLGCRLENGAVATDDLQQTSIDGIYTAGELTGVGGVDLALLEGQIAGLAAAGQPDRARALFPRRRSYRSFAGHMHQAFALRDDLKRLAAPETLICRCEDVPLSRLSPHADWRSAKLMTRCGMGHCQGRTCAPAVSLLLGWQHTSIRPPILPASLATLAESADPAP